MSTANKDSDSDSDTDSDSVCKSPGGGGGGEEGVHLAHGLTRWVGGRRESTWPVV